MTMRREREIDRYSQLETPDSVKRGGQAWESAGAHPPGTHTCVEVEREECTRLSIRKGNQDSDSSLCYYVSLPAKTDWAA